MSSSRRERRSVGPDRRGGGDILRDSGGVRLPSSGGLSGGSFSMVAWEGAGLRHHPSAVRDRHLLIEVCVLFSRTVSLSHQEDLRIRGGPCLEGYSAGSWRRSPWTTYVPLDHLRAVGPPYFVNQVVQRNESGPSGPAASRHARRRPAMQDGRRGRTGRGRRNRPRPVRPRRPARRSRRARDSPQRARRRLGRVITTGPAPRRPRRPLAPPPGNALRTASRTTFMISPPGNATGRPLNNLPTTPLSVCYAS